MKPSSKIAPQKKIEMLEQLVIQNLIAGHPMVAERALLPNEAGRVLSELFKVEWGDNDTPIVLPKKRILSNRAAGEWADTDETIELLLEGEHSKLLLPESETPPPPTQEAITEPSEGTNKERLQQARQSYESARQRGDGPAMVAAKRAAFKEGHDLSL